MAGLLNVLYSQVAERKHGWFYAREVQSQVLKVGITYGEFKELSLFVS